MGKEKKRKAAAFKCQYDEKSVKWQPCDPKTKKQKKIIPLTKHQPKRCPSEKILTRDCVKGRTLDCFSNYQSYKHCL